MRRGTSGVVGTALALAALLAALSLVTWRQSRAREVMAELDRLQREISLVTAERVELARRIQTLESRAHVVAAARERLGMRSPRAQDGEMLFLVPGGFGLGDLVLAEDPLARRGEMAPPKSAPSEVRGSEVEPGGITSAARPEGRP